MILECMDTGKVRSKALGTYYMVVNADKHEVLDMCFAGANIKRGGYLCPSIQHAVLSMLLGMAWNTSAPKEFVGRWACDRIQIQNDGTSYPNEWDTDLWTDPIVDVGVLWIEHLERQRPA